MRSLLCGLTSADVRRSPFPHIVASLPMAPDLYAALADSYPPFSRIGWAGPPERVPSNRRYELSAQMILDAPDLPVCWKDFVGFHSAPPFLAEVAALFRGYWPDAMLEALDGDLTGHSTARLTRWAESSSGICQDARIEVNTPVTGLPSASRGPHLDTPNRLFSCLFYMRHPADDSTGGDLRLFRWRNGPVAPIDRYELPGDAVEAVATVPYAANRLVIFPQSIDSIHGVSIRQPTPHLRRYVFITAELAAPWLAPPAGSTSGG